MNRHGKIHWPAVVILVGSLLLSAALPIALAMWCDSCESCR